MTIAFWTGRPEYRHTHECIAQSQLVQSLEERFSSSVEPLMAVFNFTCPGADIDLAIFKRNGIIVVEMKECALPIRGSYTGEWQILQGGDWSKSLRGGSHGSPFHQVEKYRFALMKYLDDHKEEFLPKQKATQQKFGHISSIVAISPTLHRESQLKFDQHLKWFYVVGLPELPERVQHIRSEEFHFAESELRQLVQGVLKCSPMAVDYLDRAREKRDRNKTGMGKQGKYGPLYEYLISLPDTTDHVALTFEEIETALGIELPKSAYKYQAWWSNPSDDSHPYARAWLDAGWETFDMSYNIKRKRVTFRRF